MAYIYEIFGSTYAGGEALPLRVVTQPVGSGSVPSSLVNLPGGGSWDSLGSGLAQPRAQLITITGVWLAASKNAMETKLDALKALRGTRNKLWASVDSGTTNRWRYARCLDVRTIARPGIQRMLSIEMDFELAAGTWSGAAHDETTTLATGSDNVITTNGGNARVRDVIITISPTPASPAITAVDCYKAGLVHWYWQGTLAAGKLLIINCGTKRVTNDSVDAYAGFHLHAQHADSDWLPIDPGGAVTFVVTRTGGSNLSICNLTYADGWN